MTCETGSSPTIPTTAAPPADGSRLDELDREECLRLLRTVPVGRIAVGRPGQAPIVIPVNFALDGEVVLFRSDDGDKLQALQQWPITFQVDAFDPFHRTGWSVSIHGVAGEATAEQIERVFLRPWAPGPKAFWVQVLPSEITGRQLRLEDLPGDDRGYL